ncbi:hypothetical protein CL614_05675 [archaeon]|nr:hypothetical protein [archaeon]|tara:strand:+ start:1916 stop:2341 length:426 start_codon:yes stop_codon:yes gene_type:complete
MTYLVNNVYFAELNGINNEVSVGSNGSGAVDGKLSIQKEREWITSNAEKTEFTLDRECIITGHSKGSNTSADFYHVYKANGTGFSISHGGNTVAEAAGGYGKTDEDIIAVCSGTFSIQCIGKYNNGYFCDEDSIFYILRNE